MHSVTVPRLNNNDESCVLLRWLYEQHASVHTQDVIAVLETSKATTDLECGATGILHHLVQAGDECLFGTTLAYVFEDEQEMQRVLAQDDARKNASQQRTDSQQEEDAGLFPRPASSSLPGEGSLIITKEAQEIINTEQITEQQLRDLGKKVIKKADVLALLEKSQPEATDAPFAPLSRRQIAIAETVSLSHQTIPRALVQIKIYCDHALQVLSRIMKREDQLLGLPEVIIKLVASLHQEFPFAFAHLVDDQRLVLASQPEVGITLDMGTGLFIPVIRDAATCSLLEIADLLIEYRMKALSETFNEEDMRAGNISISLQNEPDVTFALPIILPGQTCMVTLCSQQRELFLTKSGAVAERHYTHIGLAYDHRVINGAYAMQFLRALKQRLESLEEEIR